MIENKHSGPFLVSNRNKNTSYPRVTRARAFLCAFPVRTPAAPVKIQKVHGAVLRYHGVSGRTLGLP